VPGLRPPASGAQADGERADDEQNADEQRAWRVVVPAVQGGGDTDGGDGQRGAEEGFPSNQPLTASVTVSLWSADRGEQVAACLLTGPAGVGADAAVPVVPGVAGASAQSRLVRMHLVSSATVFSLRQASAQAFTRLAARDQGVDRGGQSGPIQVDGLRIGLQHWHGRAGHGRLLLQLCRSAQWVDPWLVASLPNRPGPMPGGERMADCLTDVRSDRRRGRWTRSTR
jgi:hypothetical protein